MNDLIKASATTLPVFALTDEAKWTKENALTVAALIGRVQNAHENTAAVEAQRELKRISNLFEKNRKQLKEPLLEAGRQLDRTVQTELQEIEKESGRLSVLTTEFQLAERRRVEEEAELQRRELARIEAEKQAELKRIADEQARIEREAREAREAAERQVREAKSKADREAAAKAKAEADERQRLADEAAKVAKAQAAQVEEVAAAKSFVEAQPIQTTREVGQVVRVDWEITVTNPNELAKFHPDCVKIEPLMLPIKAALNEGRTVKGVVAVKKTVATVRAGVGQKFIDV